MPINSDVLKTSAQGNEAVTRPAFALAIVLEDAVVNGYQLAFEVLRSLLPPAHRDTFTPMSFIRCGGDVMSYDFVGRVADSFEMDALAKERLLADFTKAFSERVIAEAGSLPAGLAGWLEAARARSGLLLALSSFAEADALAVMEKIGAAHLQITFSGLSGTSEVPLARKLVRLSRKLGLQPPRILMVAVGSVLARAALEAGFFCVAVPNDLTAQGDFGGCMFVLDKLSDLSGAELLEGVFSSVGGLRK